MVLLWEDFYVFKNHLFSLIILKTQSVIVNSVQNSFFNPVVSVHLVFRTFLVFQPLSLWNLKCFMCCMGPRYPSDTLFCFSLLSSNSTDTDLWVLWIYQQNCFRACLTFLLYSILLWDSRKVCSFKPFSFAWKCYLLEFSGFLKSY